jgi:hypothetical protein
MNMKLAAETRTKVQQQQKPLSINTKMMKSSFVCFYLTPPRKSVSEDGRRDRDLEGGRVDLLARDRRRFLADVVHSREAHLANVFCLKANEKFDN